MRFLFDDPNGKIEFKRLTDSPELYKKYLEEILTKIDFNSTSRYLRNTCSFIDLKRPTILWWVVTQLASYDWTNHLDCGHADYKELCDWWACYQPHLIFADNLDGVIDNVPDDYFKALTHVVAKNPTQKLIEMATRRGVKVFKISHLSERKKIDFQLEQICGPK